MLRKILASISFVLLAASAFAVNVSLAQLDASGLLLTQSVDAYVSVTDSSGKPVDGLSQAAFTIAESSDNAAFQDNKITGFKPKAAAASGITFLLVIDDSGSMYDSLSGKSTTEQSEMRITHAKAAVRAFLSSMTNPEDRVGLVYFNTYYKVLSAPTKDRDSISAKLDEIARPSTDEAYTELYYSLGQAAGEFAGIQGRKAIIVLSDGENFPYASAKAGRKHSVTGDRIFEYTEPILTCQEEGVTVYGINFGEGTGKDKNLKTIAVETGGQTFNAGNSRELAGVYESIHRQVTGEYLITYTASIAPAEKKYVRVTVKDPSGDAKSSRFYFASTVFGLPMENLSPLLIVPFALAFLLLFLLTLIKLEVKRRPASLEVLQTHVGYAPTRVIPLTSARTVIGGSKSANLTIVGAPAVKDQHATIVFDQKDKSYTIVGAGDIMVNNQPVKTRKLEAGDVIDVGGATIVFDEDTMKGRK